MSNELILAISGNDIFSGGGLHADLATFTTNKQHGFVALTCLTAMTENGFEVIPVDTNVFKQQLDSLKDVPFSAIKIGFLYKQVRNMVGTLLKIGNGRMPVSQVKTVLESRNRNLAGPTAAGNGLYLKEIRYE